MWKEKAVRKDWGLNKLGVVPRSLGTNKVDRVKRDGTEFKEAKGQEAQTLENDEVCVELCKFLDRGCKDVEGTGGVAKRVADAIEKAGSLGGGPKDGKEEEEVEEGEEEVFGDEGEFDFALGDHALEIGKP